MKKIKIDQLVQKQIASKCQQKIKEVICPQGHRATILCNSALCKETAFSCSQQKCSCSKKHEKCSTRKLIHVIKKIQQKVNAFNPVIAQNQKLIQEKIGYLQDFIEKLKKLKKQLSQIIYLQCCSLYPLQKNIFLAMLNKKTDLIKSCNIREIQYQLFKDIRCQINKQIQKLKQFWKNNETNLTSLQYKLNKNLFYFKNRNFLSQPSNIIQNGQQIINLCQAFQNKIQSLTLLYRASQSNFETKKYRQVCEKIPHTLTLIQTDLNKKCGGYTEYEWSKVNQNKNNANKVFVFSLTKPKTKFSNLRAEYSSVQGPIFYQEQSYYTRKQLKLINKNNINSSNSKNVIDNDLYDSSFKTKQWEVWQVIFKKKNDLSREIIII